MSEFMNRMFNSYFGFSTEVKPTAHHGEVSRPRNGDAADSPYIWRDNGLDTPGWVPPEIRSIPKV